MPDASPRDLFVVSVTDPAIERNDPPQTAAIERYAQRRTVDTLAAVRMFTSPTVYRVRALSGLARTRVLAAGGLPLPGERYSPAQLAAAVRAGVVSFIREARLVDGVPEGPEETFATAPSDAVDFPFLTPEGYEAVYAQLGGGGHDELGEIILRRAEMHPRRAVDFSLPRSAHALI